MFSERAEDDHVGLEDAIFKEKIGIGLDSDFMLNLSDRNRSLLWGKHFNATVISCQISTFFASLPF